MSITKLLNANRVEIAVRITRAGTELGIKTVQVYRVILNVPILGKLIIHFNTSKEATSRFTRAVKELKPAELKTIAPLFSFLLDYSDVKAGALHKKRAEP
tara:strand:+ start:2861 stop:3160 length:300 start_codon:yes stop_codon:yes gene_type:complete